MMTKRFIFLFFILLVSCANLPVKEQVEVSISEVPESITLGWNVVKKSDEVRTVIKWQTDALEDTSLFSAFRSGIPFECEYESDAQASKSLNCRRSWSVSDYSFAESIMAGRSYSGMSGSYKRVIVVLGEDGKKALQSSSDAFVFGNCTVYLLDYIQYRLDLDSPEARHSFAKSVCESETY